jgi:hypothetical protein
MSPAAVASTAVPGAAPFSGAGAWEVVPLVAVLLRRGDMTSTRLPGNWGTEQPHGSPDHDQPEEPVEDHRNTPVSNPIISMLAWHWHRRMRQLT